jgi:hypothetical protein
MYKLIKHNITEEYFDNPVAGAPAVKLKSIYDNTSDYQFFHPLPDPVINEDTLTFTMDARTALTKYGLGMINFAVASFANLDSLKEIETRLYKSGAEIGDFLVPYYGMTAGASVGKLLGDLARIGTECVYAVKNGESLDAVDLRWEAIIEDISAYLNRLNPTYWPTVLIKDQFTNLCKFWKNNFIARFEKNTADNVISLDNIFRIAVTGVPDHVKAGYSSIADTISRGIIAQFARLFVK